MSWIVHILLGFVVDFFALSYFADTSTIATAGGREITLRHWIAVVKITDKGRGGDEPSYHSIHEIRDALQSLADSPAGIDYTWELHEVSKEPAHHGTEKDV